MRIANTNEMMFRNNQEMLDKCQRTTADPTSKQNEKLEREAVSLSVSPEGMEKCMGKEPYAQEKKDLQEMAASLREQRDEESPTEEMGKMLEIARRISNGDHVPTKDEQALMEYNRDLYQAAKAAAILNENKEHKNYDSMWEDEDSQNTDEKCRELERENVDAPELEDVENTEESES